tara:strand:- start:1863 stop:2234 length:372 start_codon:yes stop_codon:yes gene_type:complete
METHLAQNIGLGGDGDEIAAIQEVEREFGVKLDYSDAHNWRTAGDVYAALGQALSSDEASRPDVWRRFTQALSRETGISPSSVSLDSGLIAEDGIWIHVSNGSALLWSAAVLTIVVAVCWAWL